MIDQMLVDDVAAWHILLKGVFRLWTRSLQQAKSHMTAGGIWLVGAVSVAGGDSPAGSILLTRPYSAYRI